MIAISEHLCGFHMKVGLDLFFASPNRKIRTKLCRSERSRFKVNI